MSHQSQGWIFVVVCFVFHKGVLGIELNSSCLQGKHFALRYFPSPLNWFEKLEFGVAL